MKEHFKNGAVMTWGLIKIPIYAIAFFIAGGIMGVKGGFSAYFEESE